MPTKNGQKEPERNTAESSRPEQTPSLSKEQFWLLVENVSDIITVLDGDGTIHYTSPSLERVLGYRPEDLVGKGIGEFIHPDDRSGFSRALDNVVRDPGFTQLVEARFRHHDGSWRALESLCKSLPEDSALPGIVVNSRDITERRQMEEVLREQRARFQDLYENAPNAYFSVGTNGLILRCNRRAGELLGCPAEELVGKPVFELYADTPQGKEKASKIFQRFGADERTTNEELQMQRADGTPIWISLTVNAIRDADGQIVESRSMVVDITERVQAEEGLRRMAAVIKDSSSAIIIQDREGRIMVWNRGAERMYGYPKAQALKMNVSTIVPEDKRQEMLDLVQDVFQGKMVESFETQRVTKDGRRLDVWLTVTALLDEAETPTAVATTERDITERKRVDAALRRSEERYALAQRAANIGSWDWNIRTNALRWSDTIEPMFGFGRGEFGATYEAFLDRVHPEDRQYVIESVRACVEAGEDYDIEHRIVWPDGTVRWVSEAGDVFRDEHGEAIRMLGVVQDITGRKRAEERLRRYAEEQALLYTVASTVATLPSTEESLSVLLDAVLPLFDSDAGWMLLPGPTLDDVPRIVVWRGVPDTFIEAETAAPLRGCPACAPLLVGGEAQTEPTLIVKCPRLPPEVLAEANLHSHVAIPLSAGGKVLGILEIAWRAPYPYIEGERSLLIAIGQQIGVALENIQLHRQSRKLAVMEERQRLARELHDSVTQSVYSLTLFAEAGQEWAEAGDLDRVKHDLTRIGETAQQALKDMRLLVYELQPSNLEKEGLIGALHHRLNAVEKRAGVEARLLAEQMVELPKPVEEALYGIAQEALNNTLKHAEANSVTVYIRVRGEHVELEVVDDGRGFDPDAASDRGGLGLITMRERAESVGGSLTVLSAPGEGTRVKASLGLGEGRCLFDLLELERS
jgi:PAS domain S-box-containing protein